jgi:hypothetical protein
LHKGRPVPAPHRHTRPIFLETYVLKGRGTVSAVRIIGTLAVVFLAGLPSLVAAQDSGYALKFDGVSDFVRLHPTASVMAPTWTTTKTVSLWVKPTGAPVCTAQDPGACDAIFGDRPRTWGISRGVIGGEDRIWVWNYDGAGDRVGIEYVPGEWTHVALVHGDGVLSAYKNGLFVGSISSGATMQIPGQVLHVGGIINNASRNWTFEGEIDEVQVWNVALDATSVALAASDLLTGSEAGLAAYYQMTEGAGTTVADNSGHGWTGTLNDGGSGVPADGAIEWVASGALGGGTIVINDPPVADPQAVGTAEDTPVPVVLTGSDPNDDPLTFHVVSAPASGVLSGSGASLTYIPAANFHGADSFTFVAYDGRAYSAPAVVSIAVSPVNDQPVASDDSVVTALDSPVVIAVLDNDADADHDVLAIVNVGAPSNGTAVEDSGRILYTPAPGFLGTDAFTYSISDGQGGFDTATVAVNVTEAGTDAGDALRFDGASDFVMLSHTANMMGPDWQNTKTVSLWVKPTGTSWCNAPSPASCDAIFGDRPRWWGISRGVINGADRIWVWNYDGKYQIIPITYNVGEWVHIAMVHGNGVLHAYRNGQLIGSLASGATQQPATGALPVLHFGGIINNSSRNWTFEGEIDELQIWNTARTPEQVGQDMLQPLLGTPAGLAAYYRMSNGAGTALTDDSGFGWTGTLVDGGTFVPADGPILWVPSGAFVLPPS